MKTLLLIFALVSVGCTPQFKINAYLPKDTDLAKNQTYFWSPNQEGVKPGHPLHDTELHRDLIKKAIEKEMYRKGFVKDSIMPDMYIEYSVNIENKRSVVTAPLPHLDNFDYEYRVKVEQLKKGNLLIHLENSEQNQTLWIGSVETTVEAVPTDTKRKIGMVVKRIMHKLPAKNDDTLIKKAHY